MEEDITIIDNYKNLPLGKYQDILAICNDESLGELDKQVKMISILTGKTEEYLLDLPINEYKRLSLRLGFLTGGLTDCELTHEESYNLGKFELVPVTDIRKVITAQYIDFQTFHEAGMEQHLVEILSCFLVPKGKKYNQDYDIIEVQDAIRKELNVLDAMSLYAFFLVSCRELMKDTLTFSLQEARMMIQDKTKRERTVSRIQEQLTLLK